MNRAAMEQFNRKRLEAQYEMFGVDVIYLGQSLVGCHSAVQSNKELRDGGFGLIHDFICRLRKADLNQRPEAEKEITIGGTVYRIAEVVNHPLSGEWKLGLRSSV